MPDLWLPFTQDTRQQGLSNASVTTVGSGASINANGKLGKCYYLDGTSNGYITTDFPTNFGTNDFTISLWVKIPTISTGNYYAVVSSKTSSAASAGVGIYWNYTQKKFLWSTADGTNATEIWMADAVDTIVYDKWIHLVMVRDNNDAKKGYFYINGTRYELASVPVIRNITTATNLWIGRCSSGNYPLKMYISDIRVWNGKALSPKEIEILSRGLVCHYPLNGGGRGGNNLLKNSNFLQGTDGLEGYTVTGSICTKQTDCMKIVSGNTSGGIFTGNYDTVTTGDMATFSAYVKADADMTVYIGADGSGTSSCEAYTVGTTWQKISISKAKTTNNANLRLYGKGTFYVKLLKYELGSTVTPWIPNPADSAYTAMGYNSTTEYDVSGNGYNGTKTGTLTYDTDSSRYSVCTYFENGLNNKITAPIYLNTDAITMNIWIRSKNGTAGTGGYHMPFEIDGVYYEMSIDSNGYFRQGFYVNGSRVVNTTPGPAIIADKKWHMITATFDGSNIKRYIDGVLVQTQAASGTLTGGSRTVYIGGTYGSTTSYATKELYESDARIYATALSDTQVAELYNTAVSVANNGTLMGYELVEG